MAKNKDSGTKETGTKMDPARIKSIVIRSVITFILITLVIVIIVLMTVPTGLRTQPITSFEYTNGTNGTNNTLTANWGTNGSGTVDPNSSFAGSWVSGSGPALVGVEMTINKLGRVIVPGSWSIGENGQSIFTFANLQYDAAAHTLKLISATGGGSGTTTTGTTTGTTISGYPNFANIINK